MPGEYTRTPQKTLLKFYKNYKFKISKKKQEVFVAIMISVVVKNNQIANTKKYFLFLQIWFIFILCVFGYKKIIIFLNLLNEKKHTQVYIYVFNDLFSKMKKNFSLLKYNKHTYLTQGDFKKQALC